MAATTAQSHGSASNPPLPPAGEASNTKGSIAAAGRPLIRLAGLSRSEVPAASAKGTELEPFLRRLLSEATAFFEGLGEGGGAAWKAKGVRRYAGSEADVDMFERRVTSDDGGKGASSDVETWAARRSVHRDSATRGTAGWDEFRRWFKDEHAEAEDAFTKTVVGRRRGRAWDCAGVGEMSVLDGGGGGGNTVWRDFSLYVQEVRHMVGRPVLRDRVFTFLLMTAERVVRGGEEGGGERARERGDAEFVVVSVPLVDWAEEDDEALAGQKGVVVGSYVAVERFRRRKSKTAAAGTGATAAAAAERETGGTGEEEHEVEWVMAVASDARGVLPRFVQNMAVPGQIAKDVPMFLSWVAGEREKGA